MSENKSQVACAGSKWAKGFSKKYQKEYWYNTRTRETSWTDPLATTSHSQQDSISKAIEPPVSTDSSSSTTKKRTIENISQQEDSVKKSGSSESHHLQDPSRDMRSKVAIIVPFRDLHREQKRKEQLDQFLPNMVSFLQKSSSIASFRIFIVEQSDDGRKFNRGKLLNIGYDLAKKAGFTVFVFHDVDLIPTSDDLVPFYASVPDAKRPCHIARVWRRYSVNQAYFGGIVAFSSAQFEAVNGFPNNFWGWGGEDDELFKRVTQCGFTPSFPSSGHIEDLEALSLDQKLATLRSNKLWKCMNKTEVLQEHTSTWSVNGLSNLQYHLLSSVVSYEGRVVVCTVEVGLNGHWTDLVCRLTDTQLDVSVDQLKRMFEQQKSSSANLKSTQTK